MKLNLSDDHPIFEACKIGDYETVKRYLDEGISVYAESERNPAIFGIVANRGHKHILELMIHHGLDINRPYNRFGASIAEFAIHRDSVEWLEYFFQLGVPVNVLDDAKHSLLEIAASGGKIRCLERLLEKDPQFAASTPIGGKAFLEATRNNHLEAMQLLLDRGADIETRDFRHATPLIGAAKGGKKEAVEWLLDHGADILAEDNRDKTAEDWARENGHADIVQLLQSRMGS